LVVLGINYILNILSAVPGDESSIVNHTQGKRDSGHSIKKHDVVVPDIIIILVIIILKNHALTDV
jgi:hypothetical protein